MLRAWLVCRSCEYRVEQRLENDHPTGWVYLNNEPVCPECVALLQEACPDPATVPATVPGWVEAIRVQRTRRT